MGLQNSCLVTMPRDHRSEIKIFWVMSSRINLKSFDCCLCWKKWPIIFSDSEIQDVGKLGVSVAMLIHLWERIAMILKVLVIPLKHAKGHSFWPFSFQERVWLRDLFVSFILICEPYVTVLKEVYHFHRTKLLQLICFCLAQNCDWYGHQCE